MKMMMGVSPPSSVVPILSPSFRAKRRRGAAHCGHLNPCCRSSFRGLRRASGHENEASSTFFPHRHEP